MAHGKAEGPRCACSRRSSRPTSTSHRAWSSSRVTAWDPRWQTGRRCSGWPSSRTPTISRESPAFPIIDRLPSEGALVTAHDPVAVPGARRRINGQILALTEHLEQAIEGADALIIVTRWDQFNALPQILAVRDEQPLVVDGRRMLARNSVASYVGIGLGRKTTRACAN